MNFFVCRHERMFSVVQREIYNQSHRCYCVGYNISFHFNKTLTTKLKDFPCHIPTCLIDEIDFYCTFIEANTDFKTSVNKGDQRYPRDKDDKNGSCVGKF